MDVRISFQVGADDYLNYQLYIASQSPQIGARRKKARIFVTLLYVAVAIVLSLYGMYEIAAVVGVFAVLWFLFYPLQERRRYVKHFEKHIRENFRDRLDQKSELTITDRQLTLRDPKNVGKIQISELKEMVELPTLYMLRFNGGQSILLPKATLQCDENIDEKLQKLSDEKNIPLKRLPAWRWK